MSSNFRKLILIFLAVLTIFSSIGFLGINSSPKRYNKKNEELYLKYNNTDYQKNMGF